MSMESPSELETSFDVVLQSPSLVVTAPSSQTWRTLVTGWIFARRHTVTQMIVAAGTVDNKHFSSFHRFLTRAAW